MMKKREIAARLLSLAKQLTAEWTPARKDINVGDRIKTVNESLTSYAPRVAAEMKKRMAKSLQENGQDVRPNDLKRQWSQYLAYIDPNNNNNKYHYYGVYAFEDETGELRYLACNCSGRIGYIERAFDLTDKYLGTYPYSESEATRAAMKHMKPKVGKGYEKKKMKRG